MSPWHNPFTAELRSLRQEVRRLRHTLEAETALLGKTQLEREKAEVSVKQLVADREAYGSGLVHDRLQAVEAERDRYGAALEKMLTPHLTTVKDLQRVARRALDQQEEL